MRANIISKRECTRFFATDVAVAVAVATDAAVDVCMRPWYVIVADHANYTDCRTFVLNQVARLLSVSKTNAKNRNRN